MRNDQTSFLFFVYQSNGLNRGSLFVDIVTVVDYNCNVLITSNLINPNTIFNLEHFA